MCLIGRADTRVSFPAKIGVTVIVTGRFKTVV